jgi:hypothetical protein
MWSDPTYVFFHRSPLPLSAAEFLLLQVFWARQNFVHTLPIIAAAREHTVPGSCSQGNVKKLKNTHTAKAIKV